MKTVKQHISSFFLVSFILSQGLFPLHLLWFPHEFDVNVKTEANAQVSVKPYVFQHDCLQFLGFRWDWLPHQNELISFYQLTTLHKIQLDKAEQVKGIGFTPYYLRAPPAVSI